MMTSTTPVSELTYEAARDELIAIVGQLEAGTESLADAMSLWERGESLAHHCEQFLDAARERLKAAEDSVSESAPDGNDE
ncbi:MAG TPA: exodeoxyribonuclease VII small subunit [Beutenbergiaceae bacterium]|nr:exodeoxyribonuclease VII small subunit [Beutenbergiaceae bacterium]